MTYPKQYHEYSEASEIGGIVDCWIEKRFPRRYDDSRARGGRKDGSGKTDAGGGRKGKSDEVQEQPSGGEQQEPFWKCLYTSNASQEPFAPPCETYHAFATTCTSGCLAICTIYAHSPAMHQTDPAIPTQHI